MQRLRLRHFSNETRAKYQSDEEAIFELQKFIDYISARDLVCKIFFHEIDGSLYPKASVWVNSIRRFKIPSYHCHDYYELNFVLEGKCVEIINDTPRVLTKGDLLVLPPHSALGEAFICTTLYIKRTKPYTTKGIMRERIRTINLSSLLPNINVNIQDTSKTAA